MNPSADTSTRDHADIVYGLFISATIASCAYCIVTGQFNGDFFPQPVYLSALALVAILGVCLLPYAITWRLAGLIDRAQPRSVFAPSQRALLLFLLAGFALHIAVTILYGVGVLDSPVYSAPPLVVPVIQVLNRLDPYYLGAFFILATPKRAATDGLAIGLMITTSILRAGLGAFAYVLIALCIKYRSELVRIFWRAPWLTAGAALALPTVVSVLYEVRGQLRGDAAYDYSLSEMVLGRFVGRLSSFSNVAYIEQFNQSFAWSAKSLETFYFPKQALVSLLGSSFAPSLTPERLLISGTRSYEGFSTFMTGVPGNLMMAWYVSPAVATMNAMLIFGTVAAVLWLSRYLDGTARLFGMAMVIYPLTSGVANEFATLLINMLLFVLFSVIFGRQVQRQVSPHAP